MPEYRVELEAYAGPLDLLLFLVKRHEIDLHDIPIAKLTEQYLAYIEQLQQIDINVAGEFLVMAATLLEIKSQLLALRTGPATARLQEVQRRRDQSRPSTLRLGTTLSRSACEVTEDQW